LGAPCGARILVRIDDGTMCRSATPAPGPLGKPSLWPELHDRAFLAAAFGLDEAITESDKDEFAIIKRMPVMSRKKRAYRDANQYVADRTTFFGTTEVYRAFAAESDAELENTKWVYKRRTVTLRQLLEFNGKRERDKQRIFYRWVRKAYKRKYGEKADVPKIIKKGMSEELAEKLDAVRASLKVKKVHAESFRAGGFNPRPIKQPKPGRKSSGKNYMLGTLSDHATGMAVDIDSDRNAQFSLAEWAFIEKLAAKTVKRSGRWSTEDDAEELWADIQALNDAFVKNVADRVKTVEAERAKKEAEAKAKPNAGRDSTKSASPAPLKTPLAEVLGDHSKSLTQWTTRGFFNLSLDLVLEMHAHGFEWGATFASNVDLHHFELDD
jgi:hypothetical protein